MASSVHARARGKWADILSGIGIDPECLTGKHGPCPGCGGTDRFRYLRDEAGGFFCGTTRGAGVDLVMHVLGCDFRAAAERIESVIGKGDWAPTKRDSTYAEGLRSVAKPSQRSAYLSSRGLEVAPGLLFARDVEYRDDGEVIGRYDAMLAPITRADRWLTFHVTYLHRGRKAPVTPCRKILPAHGSVTGGGVALYAAAEYMGVAEGIETAIAAKMLHGTPMHAALNTALLAKWQPPPVAKSVWIYADHDENAAGHAAAWTLCHRLRTQGLRAEVVMPEQVGADWNDVLLAQSRAAA